MSGALLWIIAGIVVFGTILVATIALKSRTRPVRLALSWPKLTFKKEHGYVWGGLAAVIAIGIALWLAPALGIVMLALAIMAGIGVLLKQGWLWKTAACGALLLLLAEVVLLRFPSIVSRADGLFASRVVSVPIVAITSGPTCLSRLVTTKDPQASWPEVLMSGSKQSAMVGIPCPGTRPRFTCNLGLEHCGYTITIVYADNSTYTGNPGDNLDFPERGQVKGEFLTDTTGTDHREQFAYEADPNYR